MGKNKRSIDALRAVCEWVVAEGGEAAPGYQRILDRVDWSAPRQTETPKRLPVVDEWLETVVGLAGNNPLGDLGRAVLAEADLYEWFGMYYSYVGHGDVEMDRFVEGYAIIRLTGPKGMWYSEDLTSAVTIQGPNTFYPAHVHIQREVYGVIGGRAQWLRGGEPWVERESGEVIYHPSGVRHAVRTGDEPLMAFASWLDSVSRPSVIVTG